MCFDGLSAWRLPDVGKLLLDLGSSGTLGLHTKLLGCKGWHPNDHVMHRQAFRFENLPRASVAEGGGAFGAALALGHLAPLLQDHQRGLQQPQHKAVVALPHVGRQIPHVPDEVRRRGHRPTFTAGKRPVERPVILAKGWPKSTNFKHTRIL